ncbi:Centrosome-associated protein 350 [Tinamus guttatus]|uniref:Centrosome-associated protein 350 n=1 Tax=Tinamus guttatus TaxID=94827 RepID=A0A099Z1A3_TINGU|nr:Centrosome-associated protein 350 [Tinamus guttatus]
MWSNKSNEVPLQNPRHNQTKDSSRGNDLTAAWATFSQTKAALRHIENKLEIVPTSTAVFDSIMDAKKPCASTSRKIGRKANSLVSASASRSSGQNKSSKEKSSRSPLRATTLESNVKKSNRVEFREPLASYRDTFGPASYQSSSHIEAKRLLSSLDFSEAEGKAELASRMIYDRDERDLHSRDFESPGSSAADETVVRYLNDRPAIDALQNNEVFFKVATPPRLEEEKNSGSRDESSAKTPVRNASQDTELKGFQLAASSPSATSTSSAHRLEILKRRQHDAKLEKLKERIRKQWEQSEELGGRGQHLGYAEQPVVITNTENAVTPKVRKVAAAPAAPAYKGFNKNAETKVRTPDGKVWHEEEFRISQELYRDVALQLAEDSTVKEKPSERNREKKATRPVRKVQKLTRLPSPESRQGGNYVISASSWREGQKLVKKILGPAPRIEQDRRAISSDRAGRERATKSGRIGRTGSDSRLDVTHKTSSRSSERSRSKVRSETSLKKRESTRLDGNRGDHTSLNKDFLPVEIRGILDDLQLDSMSTKQEKDVEKQNQKCVLPAQNARSHSPTKRKPDKLAPSEEPQVISKKRHYDTDEVRQYIIRQQEERKKKQNEEKKAQKEATEQKNKRLQELYRKQKEAFTKVKNVPPREPSAAKRLQETYSKLLLERTFLEQPAQVLTVQEMQPRPGYQPSGESDKENKAQERPPSASSSSDMSLSEPQQPLLRSDLMEPAWVQPDRLSPRAQLSRSQAHAGSNGGPCFQNWSLEQMGLLSKECDTVLAGRRNHAAAVGSLTLPSQPYLNSSVAQQNLSVKSTANQYKSKLDRIEALKATAASLSSRIESEAKKLAGAGINYGTMWSLDHEFLQENQDDGRWAKAVSPPVREENEDAFSARIQKMLGTCVSHTAFDDNLPGVGNLSEFKKLPEIIRPHTAAVSLGMRSPAANRHEGILGHLSKRQTDSPGHESQGYGQNKAVIPYESSIDSISEGPLLSEESLSEEEGGQHKQSPLEMLDVLKEEDFCVRERNAFEPIKEFQKEAEKYSPLFTQTSGLHSKGPWEELAKGSPHSVINIFAKSYQLHGKVFDERPSGAAALLRPLLPAASPPESIVSYEDDFASSQGSSTLTDKKIARDLSSNSSIQEELSSRKSPHKPRSVELASQHSSGPRSAASSRSSASSKRRGKKKRLESCNGNSHHFPVEGEKMPSDLERGSHQAKKSLSSNRISNKDLEQTPDTDSTLENLSAHSLMSFSDKGRSQKTPTSSPSPGSQKLLRFDSVGKTGERAKSPAGFSASPAPGLKPHVAFSEPSLGMSRPRAGAASASGCMRFSPAGLQHRFSAELNYLSAIEESVRQLSDVERVRGISLAQQESVSLAQILKAKQQRHERDLALLKMKAEQEALESQRQLEEVRQKAAQVHAESLQQLVQARQEAVEVMQENTCKIVAKQVEAALLTTDAARQIREMTELAQISDTVNAPAAPMTTLFDHQRQHHMEFIKQLRARADANRKSMSGAISQSKEEKGDSKQTYSPVFDSYSESSRSKIHDQSSTSSRQESPSVPSSKENEKKLSQREKTSSCIEEQACTAVDDSLPSDSVLSLPDEKDSASIATEYSLKFDESMTEDEIEEKSFRSLLPSESHRRINLEKKRGSRDSDEDVCPGKEALSSIKELSMPFSRGQDSFSKFTMEMVRQYMKEEEMRAAHHSSLLRLRERALKEKTKAELAWLEHQKKHLRDKGEDDKMPPITKLKRNLLLKLQQEKAEIKHLQEANKAARKERLLILKQQAEIEKIHQTTMKLQEKLKSAGENKLVSVNEIKQSNASSPLPTDAETRTPSPVSVSSSETSSIMEKLKKMRSRMDEKFLTKREQKLMQRRQHAEELLEWKRRLDAEEAEIRRMEKQALAAWDKELKPKTAKKELGDQRTEPKETASEEESPVPSCSHLNSESSVPEDLGSPAPESVPSETMGHGQSESPNHHTITEEMAYPEDIKSSTSPSKLSPPKSSVSVSKQDSSKSSHRVGGQLRSVVKSHQISNSWSDESLSMTQSETTSDQSDIEGRIMALKDELRKRKSVVYQLKKEQKKRQKERLKAQEASLIKQLETYDEFIKKTEAELSQDLETSPTAKPQIKTLSSAVEKPKIKAPPLHRPETAKNWKSLTETERSRASLESIAEHGDTVSSRTERSVSVHSKVIADVHAEEPSQTPSLILKSTRRSRAESGDSLDNVSSSPLLKDIKDINKISHGSVNNTVNTSSDETVFSHKSEIQEDIENIKSEEYEPEEFHDKPLENSDVLLMLDKEQESSPNILPKKVLFSEDEQFQKELSGLTEESLHGAEEILDQKLSDKDTKIGQSVEESSHKLSKAAEEKDYLLSEQGFTQKEQSYLEDFEVSLSIKEASVEDTLLKNDKDDSEASLLSPKGDSQSLREQSQHAQTDRSRSTSLGSDGEISECLSDRSLSLSGSMRSERLLELKSPTEFLKNDEHGDVEKEQAKQATIESPPWASASILEETDSLLNFNIGDRVLVSKVQPGTLRFKGPTEFAKGFWAGVELDKPEGNNNGTYDGIKYFDCKEKHGIFAPPQKISHIPESIDSRLETKKDEDSFFDDRLDKQHTAKQKGKGSSNLDKEEEMQRDTRENYSQDKGPADTTVLEASVGQRIDGDSFSEASNIKEVSLATKSLAQEQSVVDYLKHAAKEEASLAPPISGVMEKTSTAHYLEDISDFLSEKLERQKTLGEECAEKLDDLSPEILEKPSTPLLDLLKKEKNQLEAQLRQPIKEEERTKKQLEKVSLLTDSLLRDFVKDTVNQLQQIKKARNEKIQLSNQELCDVKEEPSTPAQHERELIPGGLNNFFLSSDLEDEREELSSPDMCPRPESPVFGASGQEELAKKLAELELNREFLSVLGEDQDWFEDYGLNSHKVQQKQAEEPAVLAKVEPQKVPTKPCEEPLAVPYTAVEVEGMVHAAAEELWKLKELGHDIQSFSRPMNLNDTTKEQDMEMVNKQVYKKAVFDLTKEIFGEIFAEDPNLNQPIWMKPCRIASTYFRRVKDPNDLDEIKNFIAAEVLKLFNLRKEPNHKTDWQKMMKFGRKKRDRVDHILVQELHEEEAQWVNYDEDELCVKMQLADGIFEALIRDTVDVLNQINEKQRRLLLV